MSIKESFLSSLKRRFIVSRSAGEFSEFGERNFSDSERKALEAKGFSIYRLTGKSIQDIQALKIFPNLTEVVVDQAKRRQTDIESPSDFIQFFVESFDENPDFEQAIKYSGRGEIIVHKGDPFHEKDYPKMLVLPSKRIEVAINTSQPFLPESNNKSLEEQQKLVEQFSDNLRAEPGLKNVKTVIGEVPDYVEIIIRHFLRHGVSLFGEMNEFGEVRTKTSTFSKGYHTALVGVQSDGSILIEHTYSWAQYLSIWVSPIIIPDIITH